MSVDITSDGSYAIAGYSADPTFNIDIWLLKVAGEQIIGDFNSDGYVDAADLQLFGDHWHFDENSPGWDPLYNLSPTPDPTSGLQIIDAADLQVFGDHWHEGTPPKSGQGGKNGKGPNENAGIVFDLDATTYGNQNLTSIPSQPGGTYIQVDVYCTDVQNLDTYEFEVIYDPTELAYVTATPTNPITYEPNILTSNGGEALGWMIDTSTPGVLSIAYTLAGTDPAQAPEGEGLIADIVFQALVATHGTLTFGDVYFYDSYGVVDLITDTGTATLPVELAAFTATYVAENGYTSIYWATASETDVNGFNVYRNTDDDFGTAMRINYDLIPGYGTTSEPKEYTFIDDNPVVFDITYYYWLESIDFGGETHVYASISLTPEEGEGGYVNDFKENRLGNHPNPFKGSTTIEYAIKGRLKAEPVEIRIYNVAGQLIETIEARYGTAKWNVDNLPTGVYFYQLKTENYNEVKKMLLIR
ncbi:MAG: T9SS type A sorting domain-containing protein [Candidatus Cloacimonetes bacterium]|nr:T9SS type A sorting domain-containing protein [Candidatus Cloacimonadota bacterium]